METEEEGRVQRVCYMDAALITNLGHHANACRQISGELRRRGIAVDILANASVENSLVEELGVKSVFRHNPYRRIVKTRSANFRLGQASFLADFDATARAQQYDLVYVNSVFPAQMAATIHWGQTRFSAATMPPIAMEFAFPSGVGDGRRGSWGQYTELYPAAAAELSGEYVEKFLFFTFDAAASREYSGVLGFKVETLPAVYAGGEIRLRTGDEQGRPVVGFLGHQRFDKGYHLLPDLLRLLLKRDIRARFLIHNGDVADTKTDRELRELAAADPRICFEQRPADQGHWNALLDGTDICALPYEPGRYAASVSAVAVEAVSCGLPIVSPNGTTMKTLAETYQNNTTGISEWTVEAIADAIVEAVRNFSGLAESAYEGAERWVRENGASACVSRLLDFAATRRPPHPAPPATRFEPVLGALNALASANLKRRDWWRRRRERRRRARTA